jgi:hypothetical protein
MLLLLLLLLLPAVQLCALRAAYQSLVSRSFPNWYESVAAQLEEQAAQQ